MAISNQLARIMAHANAGKQLNAPTEGKQKVVNADGTVTEIPYMEDRFGRRTVMTSQGPQVLQGHEGKDPYGDLGGAIGNVLGGLINKGRLGRQERIAEKSVAEQEMANPTFVGPSVPSNQAELQKARERMSFEMPKEKIDYFDVSTVQSSVKPSALQEKLNIYLPAGVTVGGRTVNGVKTSIATREQLQEAMKLVAASSSSATTTHFAPKYFKNLSRFVPDNAGNMKFYGPNGLEIKPTDAGYKQAIKEAQESGALDAGAVAFATAQETDRSKRITEIGSSIGIAEGKQAIYGNIITAIDDGAQTGYLTDLFPSMTEATVALNNLQGELGLNVLQSTTFGALSKDELKFALSTALPTSMEPEALRRWVVRKQEAQRKLIDYLYEAGDYIGQGGTQFGFMAKKRREQRGKAPDASSAEAPTSNLDFLPEEERQEAQEAIDAGLVTIEQLRES
jgi:hypothetical protein